MTNKVNRHIFIILLLVVCFAFLNQTGLARTDIDGPAGSVRFGSSVHALPNGNIVVADSRFSPDGSPAEIGAVYLLSGTTGAFISTLTGTSLEDRVGDRIIILSNGNFVVASRDWNNDVGAVTWCSGTTGCNGTVSGANSLIGTVSGDRVGDQVMAFSNGNFIQRSPNWDNAAETNAGAVTFCNGMTGCSGVVSETNSLVGSTTEDRIGDSVTILSDEDYVVKSELWDNGAISDVGSATWCSGASGCSGTISPANSLVGSQDFDGFGMVVTPLLDGRYAVQSRSWNNGAMLEAGAVTLCQGATGCVGTISPSNSLVGILPNSLIGFGKVIELSNGNVVVSSTRASIEVSSLGGNIITQAGAVTFCNGFAACVGGVTENNSLHGENVGDQIGLGNNSDGLIDLPNGNYVVISPFRKFVQDFTGAVTFCSGTTGCSGPVTNDNSLYGNRAFSRIGNGGVLVSPNSSFVVLSPDYGVDGIGNSTGAVTFCDGTSSCTGLVSDSNSLIGEAVGDRIGQSQNRVLSNGNFLIRSQNWGSNDRGAITFCDAVAGCPIGQISSANSLTGSQSGDAVGNSGLLTLNNGNYVVLSSEWNNPGSAHLSKKDSHKKANLGSTSNVGAATFCNGTTGCVGNVTSSNSLIGSIANDRVGRSGQVLNENYVIGSEMFDFGGMTDVGAVTWCDEDTGCVGEISAANSLIGSTQDDLVSSFDNGNGLSALSNGDYVVISTAFDDPNTIREKANGKNLLGDTPSRNGAVTFGDGANGTFGNINNFNSVIGTSPTGGHGLEFAFDEVNNQLVVGREVDNAITLFKRITPQKPPYDFDGDGRTDLSIFRPSTGDWHVNQSTDGYIGVNLGISTDILAAADYDGDDKTDYAVWRPDAPTVAAFYILQSTDFTLRIETFGQTGDSPIVVGDWDGDGKADPAVYRDSASGSQSRFYYLGSDDNPGNNTTFLDWGTTGDEPLTGDFDGDGKSDLAVFRPSDEIWYIQQSSDASIRIESYGFASDRRLPGDFDGDGKTDLALYRDSENNWYYLQSSDNQSFKVPFGLPTDQLTPGDYDGDGKTDVAVFRDGDWYVSETFSGNTVVTTFGLTNDAAVPSSVVGN